MKKLFLKEIAIALCNNGFSFFLKSKNLLIRMGYYNSYYNGQKAR